MSQLRTALVAVDKRRSTRQEPPTTHFDFIEGKNTTEQELEEIEKTLEELNNKRNNGKDSRERKPIAKDIINLFNRARYLKDVINAVLYQKAVSKSRKHNVIVKLRTRK